MHAACTAMLLLLLLLLRTVRSAAEYVQTAEL
jgi:hypothetical protein